MMNRVTSTRRHQLALLPLILMAVVGLAVLLFPPTGPDQDRFASVVRPPVADAGMPQTIADVAQGQPVGEEAYWKGFRLNAGWHLAPTANSGRYTLAGNVTNFEDSPASAQVLVRIRVADRYAELLLCEALLKGKETKTLSCVDVAHAQYSSRWSRIILQAS
jgi:hypothetical protein